MLKKISVFLTKYKALKIKIDFETKVKDVLLTTIESLIINIILFLIPVLLVYNLFVIDSLHVLLIVLIYLIVALFSYSYQFFYFYLLKDKCKNLKNLNLKLIMIADSIITALILMLLTSVIVSIF